MITFCIILLSVCIVYLAAILKNNGFKVEVNHNKFISLTKEKDTTMNEKSTNIIAILFVISLALCLALGFNIGKETIHYQQVTINSISGNSIKDKININKATKQQLMTLEGVGEVKAQAIIKHRPYNDIWELCEIDGISNDFVKSIESEVTC